MTLQLRVESAAWNRHIAHTAAEFGDLIPVIKGNGYGFGRKTLAEHAGKFADLVAVGTVFETSDVPEKSGDRAHAGRQSASEKLLVEQADRPDRRLGA